MTLHADRRFNPPQLNAASPGKGDKYKSPNSQRPSGRIYAVPPEFGTVAG